MSPEEPSHIGSVSLDEWINSHYQARYIPDTVSTAESFLRGLLFLPNYLLSYIVVRVWV